jgi:hypothetical protein
VEKTLKGAWMPRFTVRCTERTLGRLDTLARERSMTRAALVRRLVEGAIDGMPLPVVDAPDRDELLALLSEKAREGNVAAIRALLTREEQADPRERAIMAFEQLAAGESSERLLGRAFAALGAGPTRRELALVADALRASGDEKALAALEVPLGDTEAFDQLAALAREHGSSAFVVLDLKTVIRFGVEGLTRGAGELRRS